MSGYLFYYVKFERGGYNNFLPFVKNKAKRLLVPYLFITLCWLIPVYISVKGFNLNTILWKFVLGTSPSQLWFLLMLFWVFVLIFPFSKLLNKHPIIGFFVSLVPCVLGTLIIDVNIFGVNLNFFGFATALQYIPFFTIGFLLRRCKNVSLFKINSIFYLLVAIGLLAVKILTYGKVGYEIIYYIATILSMFFGGIAGFVVIFRINRYVSGGLKKVLDFFSANSMVVYLIHEQFIYYIILLLNGLVSPYLIATICFVGSLGVSLLIAVVLRRWKTTRFLVGEK